jgi:serine/threonine-protein kinase
MRDSEDLLVGVRPGDVLAGKYRVERLLGVGGMGVVVCAHHMQLDERVALKFLRPEALENAEAVARFDREARAAVKIKSEHVARVSDVGRLENGAPYMVMEYLDGHDLAARLAERGPLPVEEAVEFVLQASEAIADAHALGIIHRDLKPANLFCTVRSDGMMSIKVLDFGISKLTAMGASQQQMTRTQGLMGSPFYMSPEQLQAIKVDARSDIWALGIILYELVTGRVPFTAEGLPQLVLRIVATPAPSLRALRPDVPVVLESIVQRCLEKDRENRFGNVAELAEALAPLAPKRALASVEKISRIIQNAGLASSVARPVARSIGDNPPPPGAGTVAAWGQTAPGARKKTTTLVVGVLGTVTLAAVVAAVGVATRGFGLRRSPSSPAAAASPAAPSLPSPPSATQTPPAETLVDLGTPTPPASVAPSASPVPPPATRRPPVAPPPAVRPPGGGGSKAPPAAPVCSAVPYLDSDGNTHFKQVCK